MTQRKTRSPVIDRVRGAAILLVMLGHTMTGCTSGAESSFLYKIIWSLQMPLFFLISGYVTRYSREISDWSVLVRQLGRRTLQLLLPFAVWTFLVRGLLFGQTYFLNVGWLIRHMDSGYWFLFSLWTISVVYLFSVFLSGKLLRGKRLFGTIILFGLLLALLALLAFWQGTDFLGLKLTLYYSAFYLLGALAGALIEKIAFHQKVLFIGTLVSIVIWLSLLAYFDFYSSADDLLHIALRAFSSLLGCVVVFGIAAACRHRKGERLPRRGLQWVGSHTLELYLVHYLCLNLIRPDPAPACVSFYGAGLTILNFFLTLFISVTVTIILSRFSVTRLLLYGKK